MSLSVSELCQVLLLPADAGTHTIRARAARLATGKPEMGSSPAIRRTLVEALRLAPGCGDMAIVRVIESILLRPHPSPVSRAPVYTGTIDARGAMTLAWREPQTPLTRLLLFSRIRNLAVDAANTGTTQARAELVEALNDAIRITEGKTRARLEAALLEISDRPVSEVLYAISVAISEGAHYARQDLAAGQKPS